MEFGNHNLQTGEVTVSLYLKEADKIAAVLGNLVAYGKEKLENLNGTDQQTIASCSAFAHSLMETKPQLGCINVRVSFDQLDKVSEGLHAAANMMARKKNADALGAPPSFLARLSQTLDSGYTGGRVLTRIGRACAVGQPLNAPM